jgi:hypothetical protein
MDKHIPADNDKGNSQEIKDQTDNHNGVGWRGLDIQNIPGQVFANDVNKAVGKGEYKVI